MDKDNNVFLKSGSCLFRYISEMAVGYWLMYMQEEEDTAVVISNILEIEEMSYNTLVKRYKDVTKEVDRFMDDRYGID